MKRQMKCLKDQKCYIFREHRGRARVEQPHVQPGRPHRGPGEGERERGSQTFQT